jgi:hypothetical protein
MQTGARVVHDRAASSTPTRRSPAGLVRSLHAPDELLPAARAAGARDRRQHGAGVGGADAADAVAAVGGRASDVAHRIDSRAIQARGLSAM